MIRALIGHQPCIGVVAHIDPRTYPVAGVEGGSVRASQEPAVKERLERVTRLVETVTLWDGSRVNVVPSPVIVGTPRDAALAQQYFEGEGVDSVIHTMCTWSMGWETQFFGHPDWPELYEAMNGTSWPGAVLQNSLRASKTAHLQPVWCSYPPDVEGLVGGGETLHPVTVHNIRDFVICAAARAMMRGKSYASIGHVSMGIAGSEGISDIYARWLGMKFVHVDQLEVHMRVQSGLYDRGEVRRAEDWFLKTFEGRIDPETRRTPAGIFRLVEDSLVPMTLVVRDILRGNDALESKDMERSQGLNGLLGGTAGQRYWTDWLPNFDFTEAILSSTFDWNGLRPPIICATENDGLNGMAMLWGTMLTGCASLFADLRTYWSPEVVKKYTDVDIRGVAPTGFLHLINSGPAALDWATQPAVWSEWDKVERAIAATTWYPAELGYFPHDGLSTHFRTPGNIPVTLVRFNRIGPELTLSIIEGHTVDLPEKVADFVRQSTNPTWPDTFVAPVHIDLREVLERNSVTELRHALARHVDTLEVMARGIDPNHVAAAVGHVGRNMHLLAAMLRIPVDFTNVPNPWYPTLWQRLGGDHEACRRLGPLYA